MLLKVVQWFLGVRKPHWAYMWQVLYICAARAPPGSRRVHIWGHICKYMVYWDLPWWLPTHERSMASFTKWNGSIYDIYVVIMVRGHWVGGTVLATRAIRVEQLGLSVATKPCRIMPNASRTSKITLWNVNTQYCGKFRSGGWRL